MNGSLRRETYRGEADWRRRGHIGLRHVTHAPATLWD